MLYREISHANHENGYFNISLLSIFPVYYILYIYVLSITEWTAQDAIPSKRKMIGLVAGVKKESLVGSYLGNLKYSPCQYLVILIPIFHYRQD